MEANNIEITLEDMKAYFLSESAMIDTDPTMASEILLEYERDPDAMVSEGLELIAELTEKHQSQTSITWNSIVNKLSEFGLAKQFIQARLFPDVLQAKFDRPGDHRDAVEEALEYVFLVFGWSTNDLLSNQRIEPVVDIRSRYKRPGNSNINQVLAYSHYAQFIAKTALKAYNPQNTVDYPRDVDEFRTLLHKKGGLGLESLVSLVWDLGICLVPLKDSGVFHGACWNIDGKHVIVLKQKTSSQAKWIFDLLHELYHVFVHLEDAGAAIVELEEITFMSIDDSEEEGEANAFANRVIFGTRAEDIAKKCLDKANRRLDRLKRCVLEVADEEGIRADFIANYIAYRLSLENHNWWGTADSLQVKTPSPADFVLHRLIDHLNFEGLNTIERNMLSMAIDEYEK